MNKIIIGLIAVIVIVGGLWLYSTFPKQEELAIYSDSQVSVSYPKNWIMETPRAGTQTTAKVFFFADAKREDGVVIYARDDEQSLDSYIKETKSSFPAGYSILQESDRTAGSIPAHILAVKVVQDGVELRQKLLLVVNKGRVYAIYASGVETRWAQLESTFDSILDSVRLK